MSERPDDDRTRHRLVKPDGLPPPVGFAHAVVPAAGRTVYLGGQTGHGVDGRLVGDSLLEQLDQALANVALALEAVGGSPGDLVSIQLFVSDAATYRASLREIGEVWRRRLGPHYPAVSLFEVSGLFDPQAVVEVVGVAVVAG